MSRPAEQGHTHASTPSSDDSPLTLEMFNEVQLIGRLTCSIKTLASFSLAVATRIRGLLDPSLPLSSTPRARSSACRSSW